MFDAFVIPVLDNGSEQDVVPLADFIARRLLRASRSLKTAIDQRERDEILADILVCTSCLTLLTVFQHTEDAVLTDRAKQLLRQTV